MNPSTIKKILDGKPLSYNVQEKLIAAAERQLAADVATGEPSKLPSMVERLKHVHQLYEDLGTLEAAGRVIGVTRERVRQILVKGSRLGWQYKPFEYPFVPKEKLIADYRRLLSLGVLPKRMALPQVILKSCLQLTELRTLAFACCGPRDRKSVV